MSPAWPPERAHSRWADALTEDALRDWCRANMAACTVPAVSQFVDSLPKSSAGKVMWRALQERERSR